MYNKIKTNLRSSFPNCYKKMDKHKIPIKYLISGGTAATVDLLSLFILTDILNIHYVLSASLAFAIAFFISFYLQKFWTFRDNGCEKLYRQMFIYFGIGLINLGINAGGMYILVEHILPQITIYNFNMDYLLSQIIMGIFIAVISFVVYRYVIFKRNKKENEDDNEKLNILIATGIFPPDIGGPATYADALSCELLKLGCEIKIVTYTDCLNPKFQIPNSKQISNPQPKAGSQPEAGTAPREDKSQIPVYCIKRKQNIIIRYFKYFWLIFKLCGRADVVYILDLVSAGAPAVLAAKLRGKKVVFRTGGDFLWEKAFQSGWTNLPFSNYYQTEKKLSEKSLMLFCRFILKKIDLIVFSTRLQADIYANYYRVPQNKIKLIANPIPELKAGESDEKYKYSIVFAGRLIKLKNLDKLIKVFGELQDKNIKLLICGEGPEKSNLQKLIDDLKLNERVTLAGNIEHEELIRIISGCKFFILPSITEISPNLALECISLKKPILLTAETGLSAEITEKLLTLNPLSADDLKNKIKFLLIPENLSRYEERLKQLSITKRSWEDVAREHIVIFKNLSIKKLFSAKGGSALG